jgi:glycosyltransferase involved in cell wall biosynthesis
VSPDTNTLRAATPLDWLRDFERRHGRPLRVLHIGNIANNAYNNAKIERGYGIEADVLCHDYYHVMGCPEWEDASFDGRIDDEMFPDWWAVGLKGYRRPRWFAQGPLDASVRYLLAKNGNAHAALLWRSLQAERWLLCRKSRAARLARKWLASFTGCEIAYVAQPANSAIAHTLERWLSILLRHRVPFRSALSRLRRRVSRVARAANLASDAARHRREMRKKQGRLIAAAAALVPPATLLPGDLERVFLWWWHPYLRLLLSRYDVIQGYGIFGEVPLAAGVPFIAYEHGTIRAIPFKDDAEGRLCAVTYRCAAAVFVTNSDNLEAAEKLNLEPSRVVCLPHAFDSDKLERFAQANPAPPRDPGAPPLFFSPTRQHWVDDDPGWAKGNDRVFRAMRQLLDEGIECRLRLVAWGVDLERSRALIEELSLTARVEWVPTMKKRELWAQYLAADGVIDQFVVPAMGGVTFEAMMLARPVITAIDRAQTARFFGEAPPVLSCRSVDEIVDAMRNVATDPADAAGRGKANLAWMRRYHSARRIVELQAETYRRIVESPPLRQRVEQRSGSDACRPVYSAS